MISHTTTRFRRAFLGLPEETRRQAKEAYKLFKRNPYHPSLRFKQVHPKEPIFSVRAGLGFRAVGIKEGDTIVWFWIGTHSDYDRLLSTL